MKSITKLKNQARAHEQKENWQAAIEAYQQVLSATDEAEAELDLSLYNRIGDLYYRLGQQDQAVHYYSEAAEKYAEAGLFNNAIALCNKALRYRPDDLGLFRMAAKYSAEQGFLVEARRWYLQYAERQVQAGKVEEAFEALEEFAELTDDPSVRETLADQFLAHDRRDEALQQLQRAYAERIERGDGVEASSVADRIRELDPSVDLESLAAAGHAAAASDGAGTAEAEGDESGLVLETIAGAAGLKEKAEEEAGGPEEPAGIERVADEPVPAPDAGHTVSGLEVGFGEREVEATPVAGESLAGMETFDATPVEEEAPAEAEAEAETQAVEEVEPLPLMDFGEEDAAAVGEVVESTAEAEVVEAAEAEADVIEEIEPLPLMDLGDAGDLPELGPEAAGGEELETFDLSAFDLTLAGAAEEGGAGGSAAVVPDVDTEAVLARARELVSRELHDQALNELRLLLVPHLDRQVYEDALRVVNEMVRRNPDDFPALQRRVEFASHIGDTQILADTYADLAACMTRKGAETKAATVYQRVLELDPANEAALEVLGAGAAADDAESYVDLAAFLDDEGVEALTAVEGGEGAEDFSDLFSQFKAKVTEDVAVEEAGSHYDLGLAFKEMGLIDEAIAEFQTALKGGEERMKVYEELGQCFVQKGQYTVAVKVLARALELPRETEHDLLGVYYHLGICQEELGDRSAAREAYDKIMAIDPSFNDVPERLSRL